MEVRNDVLTKEGQEEFETRMSSFKDIIAKKLLASKINNDLIQFNACDYIDAIQNKGGGALEISLDCNGKDKEKNQTDQDIYLSVHVNHIGEPLLENVSLKTDLGFSDPEREEYEDILQLFSRFEQIKNLKKDEEDIIIFRKQATNKIKHRRLLTSKQAKELAERLELSVRKKVGELFPETVEPELPIENITDFPIGENLLFSLEKMGMEDSFLLISIKANTRAGTDNKKMWTSVEDTIDPELLAIQGVSTRSAIEDIARSSFLELLQKFRPDGTQKIPTYNPDLLAAALDEAGFSA